MDMQFSLQMKIPVSISRFLPVLSNGIDSEIFPDEACLILIDPASGTEYYENFEAFSTKVEAVDGAPRILVMHF